MGQWLSGSTGGLPKVLAVVYVSATPSEVSVLDAVAAAAATGATSRLVTRFYDQTYGRGSFVIGAARERDAVDSAVSMASVALRSLDLRQHGDATHPRIGVVDHISLAPLADGPDAMNVAADAAKQIAYRMGNELGVPALLYGAAHLHERRLVDTRKLCNYFKAVPGDGRVAEHSSPTGRVDADFGPREVDPGRGVCCVGAVTLVCNYNVELDTTDRATAKRVCDAVRTKTGGPPGVEAMQLLRSEGNYEVACNLLDIYSGRGTTPEQALACIGKACAEEDVHIVKHYTIGLRRDECIEKYMALAS